MCFELVCLSVCPSVPLMDNTFRYIYFEEERHWLGNTYTIRGYIMWTDASS